MTNLGKHKPTETELSDILEELDTNNSGGVDFSEFLVLMTRDAGAQSSKNDEFREAFEVMDKDGDGCISAEDLYNVMKSLGVRLSREDIEEMIKVADKAGTGKVS